MLLIHAEYFTSKDIEQTSPFNADAAVERIKHQPRRISERVDCETKCKPNKNAGLRVS
jgi:hypothetical protein